MNRSLKLGEIILLSAMFVINAGMTIFFYVKTGFKPYLGVFLFLSFGWLSGFYFGFKRGFMLSRGVAISKQRDSSKFYLNIGILFGIYLLVLLFFVGMFLQQTGYLAR